MLFKKKILVVFSLQTSDQPNWMLVQALPALFSTGLYNGLKPLYFSAS